MNTGLVTIYYIWLHVPIYCIWLHVPAYLLMLCHENMITGMTPYGEVTAVPLRIC